MSYTLIEPCCGSAAFTLYMLGARRAILPYQGSKWRFRKGLEAIAEEMGFAGPPDRVVLTDPGPWGRVMGVLLSHRARQHLIGELEQLAKMDAFAVFKRLQGAPVPDNDSAFTAEFLFLQRLSFSGKAVGVRRGCWSSPGFNKTSAYGVAATDRFGAVKPMIPSLLRVLRDYHRALLDVEVDARCARAGTPSELRGRFLVYLDPPYVESTGYPDGQMPRDEVVALACAYHERGAAVMVSEQQDLKLRGWGRRPLSTGRDDTSPFRGKQEEWVTYTPISSTASTGGTV